VKARVVCAAVAGAGVLWAAAAPSLAVSPEATCEAGKHKETGKYAFCLHRAEAKLRRTEGACSISVTSCYRDDECPMGESCQKDTTRYAAAVARCESKLPDRWTILEEQAAAVSAACPDGLPAADVRTVIDDCVANLSTGLAGGPLQNCAGDLASCSADLGACNGDLATCNGSLGTCNADLTAAQSDLGTCTGNLTTCGGTLATCNGSLSTCGSTLAACNGSLSTCNATVATCSANLSSCSAGLATCTADYTDCASDLATVDAGSAIASMVASGATFSSGAGLGLTGVMPDNGTVNITPGTAAQTIAAGRHSGSGTVAGDADLVASNIKRDVDLFGVTGTLFTSIVPKTGQVTGYGAGSDGDLQTGAARSFTDNGDGTITDDANGLMWEKKTDDGSIHDKDDLYTWGMTSDPYTMNGTAVTVFLATLNAGGGFAGYTDWRIPNRFELETLLNLETASPPAVHSAFNAGCVPNCTSSTCSCTAGSNYWTSSTYRPTPSDAWLVFFMDGSPFPGSKSSNRFVRAVRGGS